MYPYNLPLSLTGCLAAPDVEPTLISIDAGGEIELLVQSPDGDATSCYLLIPNGDVIQLMPTNESAERYKVQKSNKSVGCAVTVKDANETDIGIWEIYTESSEGDKTSSQRWYVTVNSKYLFYSMLRFSDIRVWCKTYLKIE